MSLPLISHHPNWYSLSRCPVQVPSPSGNKLAPVVIVKSQVHAVSGLAKTLIHGLHPTWYIDNWENLENLHQETEKTEKTEKT